ncbi:TonB-dependent receptor domain-containing protein [Sphingomonas jeddahensis]|uniref:Vitamin B12 transporter BtuB n=1 Tax=Sphingomonas jeddahensis TaxID=1915074 RepID=A0A1V2EUK9_9SPHN|nr:TonB-dependent receptor [Sphingomonas jeddahensis]ONF95859.1 Vitamin B12 transporter BtuB precursor [Sphingomonas jeddahensis]
MKINALLSATALACSWALAPAVMAQTAPTDTTADASADTSANDVAGATNAGAGDNDIVVTGSRISRPNLDTAIPVTTFTATQLNNVGQVSIGETLNRLPALRSTLSQANSTASIGTAGLSALDLRGLGTDRTLVLVNGRRHVSGDPGSFLVDTNSIPNDLIERVDVVTGGNSGVYGSDAVSGVVNFVLKQDYDGLSARLQGGISDRGDRGSYLGSIVWGKNFAEGRGNITFAAEYAKSEPLYFAQRNEQTGAYTGVPGFYQTERTTFVNPDGSARNEPPAGNGVPDRSYFPGGPGNTFGIISLGGMVITSCPAASATNAALRAAVCTGQSSPTGGLLSNNYAFLQDGSLVRDIPAIDNRNVGGGVFGGRSASGVEGAMLLPGLERANFNLMGHYDVSDAFQPFFEAKYVRITANQTSTQPTFVNGRLSPAFSLNNAFLTDQARATLRGILPAGATNFNFFRFNNDIGTRAEDHKRETYRFVAGARGDLVDSGNWKYEASVNYGRTETYYETGGNIAVQRFNRATNAVRNAAGQIVCAVNADASTANDDPACRPINLFGEGAPQTTPDGIAYVLADSSRKQWAEQFNALYYVSGNSADWFSLPGGPVQVAFGAEYRREDFFSGYDEFTKGEYAPGQSNTFLNAIQDSNGPATSVFEAFGELRIPLLADLPFVHELSLEGNGRVSKYNFLSDPVYTWNAGGVFAPIPDIRFRVNYGKSVRAPNLDDLYGGTSQTFANNFIDPCSQDVINQDPNRARNCAAAGVPTTITLPDGTVRPWTNAPTSGILGTNGGNSLLEPETSYSFTVGAVLQPRFLPGFSLTVDYYNIRINNAIDVISPQQLVNRCYDDPVGLNNQFCPLVNRRRSADGIADYTFAGQQGRRFAGFPDFNVGIVGNGFTNSPFNYASLKTSGIDAAAAYTHEFTPDIKLNLRAVASWLATRNRFTFLNDPDRYTRFKSTLGDPEWRGLLSANLQAGPFDIALTSQYIGKQSIDAWNVQHTEQDRPPTNADRNPFLYYPDVFIHDVQFGIRANDQFRLYFGVDNIGDQLPPYGLTGTGSGDANVSSIFPVTGRYFYAGVNVKY